jgi:hypothetical protein
MGTANTLQVAVILVTLLVGASLVSTILKTGVPPLSSNSAERDEVIALLRRAPLPKDAVIMDLGSGWGTLVVALARAFPGSSVQGLEMSLFPYLISRWRTRNLANVSVRYENFFRSDLKNADAVTCYLMPGLMPRVSELLDRTLRPGTLVVSNTFLFRGRTVSAGREGVLRGAVCLYVWPARVWVVGDQE